MAVVTRVRISEPTILYFFNKRLNNRIYNWYIDGVHLLLRFILGRNAFRKHINNKCILCENNGNIQEHVLNDCEKNKKLRTKLTK